MPELHRLRHLPLTEARLGTVIHAHAARRTLPGVLRICLVCQTEFEVTRINPVTDPRAPGYQRYCSNRCRFRARRARHKPLRDPRITTTDNGERYYVIACTGFAITGGHSVKSTSYSILDSCANDREVAQFYTQTGTSPHQRRRAVLRCAELNADERAWEHQDGIYAPLA